MSRDRKSSEEKKDVEKREDGERGCFFPFHIRTDYGIPYTFFPSLSLSLYFYLHLRQVLPRVNDQIHTQPSKVKERKRKKKKKEPVSMSQGRREAREGSHHGSFRSFPSVSFVVAKCERGN